MNKANPINLEDQSASRGVLSPITGKKQLLSHSYASEAKGKTGFYRIIKAAGYSLDGFKAAYKFEAAFRQVFWLNLILFTAIILCPFTISVKMLLVVASFLSLIVELINTGIEASVDHTSTAKHPLAKIAKDVGSAAQFLALLLLFILWMMALLSVVF
ncbi:MULTISPECIES: diacylglycerol kinase [unclassified Psychrobacter]|uniref:diacylglycerol kinase n=1 Tax=unclassified Psychrobacter TaxID=196806 RepID=UPI000A8FD2D5|nr:diacylglycerol kinase [Psychrobacter sp. P11F6]